MPARLKSLWILWCVIWIALLMPALSRHRGWPAWSPWAIVIALVVGQVVFGRIASKYRPPAL